MPLLARSSLPALGSSASCAASTLHASNERADVVQRVDGDSGRLLAAIKEGWHPRGMPPAPGRLSLIDLAAANTTTLRLGGKRSGVASVP